MMDEPEITELQRKCDQFQTQYNSIKKEFKDFIEITRKNEELKKRDLQSEYAKKILVFADSLCRMMDATLNHPCEEIRVIHENYHLNIEGMYQQLLSSYGIKPQNPEPGTPFDDAVHMAVGIEYNSRYPENTVFSVIRRGYCRDSSVLRPAEVIISKKPRETTKKQTHKFLSALFSRIFPTDCRFATLEHQIDELAHCESEHVIRLDGEIEALGRKGAEYEEDIHDLSRSLTEQSDILEHMTDETEYLKEKHTTSEAAIHYLTRLLSEKSDIIERLVQESENYKEELCRSEARIREIESKLVVTERETKTTEEEPQLPEKNDSIEEWMQDYRTDGYEETNYYDR